MKPMLEIYDATGAPVVAPRTGARIETLASPLQSDGLERVAPRTGARIETPCRPAPAHRAGPCRPPHGGAD